MNKFVVRFTIFYCAVYFIYVIWNAWCGVNVFSDTYRFLLEYCLFVLANEHPKYHCRFARFLALSVFITDTTTYIDGIYNIFPTAESILIPLSVLWATTIIVTIVLAINHFCRVRKLKKSRYKEYAVRFRK